jgi:hypothetical protein
MKKLIALLALMLIMNIGCEKDKDIINPEICWRCETYQYGVLYTYYEWFDQPPLIKIWHTVFGWRHIDSLDTGGCTSDGWTEQIASQHERHTRNEYVKCYIVK